MTFYKLVVPQKSKMSFYFFAEVSKKMEGQMDAPSQLFIKVFF